MSPYSSDKNENVNYIKTNYVKGQKSNNRYSEKKPNYSSFRMNKKPFKKFEMKRNFLKTKKSLSSKANYGKPKIDLNKITCNICKKTGHFANRCFANQKNKVYSISVQSNNSRSLDNNLLNVKIYT